MKTNTMLSTMTGLLVLWTAPQAQAVKIQRDDLDFNKFYLITGYPPLDWVVHALDFEWYPDYLVPLGQLTGINPTNRFQLVPHRYLVPLKPRPMNLTQDPTNRLFAINAAQVTNAPELSLTYVVSNIVLGIADRGVTSGKLGLGAVLAENLAPGAVQAGSLGPNTVTAAELVNGSVLPEDLNMGAFDTTFWKVTGNAGTTGGTHFLGTTDSQPLELKVNNARAWRLEPALASPNIIGGFSGNSVLAGTHGATIAGGGESGLANSISGDYGSISGGKNNTLNSSASGSTIGGGMYNLISPASSTIGGGYNNAIQGIASYSTIAGGVENKIENGADNATIGGGAGNTIQTTATASIIGGGYHNNILPGSGDATISGGYQNQAKGYDSTVPGGSYNEANGEASFAAGTYAKATNDNAFVWADGTETGSLHANSFVIGASGGVKVFSSSARADWIASAGPYVLAGDGNWTGSSDRQMKREVAPVNPREVLEKVAAMPITTWNYLGMDPSVRHMGPMAQDFHAAFGLNGDNDRGINNTDSAGVALAAIQGLYVRLQERETQIQAQARELADLKARLTTLERLLRAKNN